MILMKIAVCAKQIPDPANTMEYSEGTLNRPDEQVLDDTDRYGIEIALQLKEKFDAEVTIISMGPEGTQKGLQQALQMGADKAYFVDDPSLKGANSLMTANVLSQLALKSEADIVIFGTESTDGYSGTVPQQVSRFLNLDCISYVKGIEINDEVKLTRQTIEGSENVNLPEKCVISVTAGDANGDGENVPRHCHVTFSPSPLASPAMYGVCSTDQERPVRPG